MLEVLTEEALPEISGEELDELRRTLWRSFGGLPERCDLGLEKVAEVDLGDLVREVIRYQVEPGEWVESYILRPKKIDGPLPGVLALHEHGGKYECGKLEPADLYTDDIWNTPPSALGWGLDLARRGYVVICPDQLCHESRNWKTVKGFDSGREHETFEGMSRLARGQTLVGKNAFDISRAVDVLVSRADVLGDRIGTMGHSGGGTNSYLACLYDPRITAAVINCGICSHVSRIRYARGHGPTGTIPGMILLGDRASGAAVMAPRAVLYFNGSEDWIMPIEGMLNTYYRAKKAYYAMGVPERLELAIAEGPHLFGPKRRERGFDWLDRWLKETPIDATEVWYRQERPDPADAVQEKLDLNGLGELCGNYLQEAPEAEPETLGRLEIGESGTSMLEEVRIKVDRTINFNHHSKQLERPGKASEFEANARTMVEPNDYLDLWVCSPKRKQRKNSAVIVLHRSVAPFRVGRDEVMGIAGDESYAIGPALAEQGMMAVAIDLPLHGGRQDSRLVRKYGTTNVPGITYVSYVSAGTSMLERAVHDVRCIVSYLGSRDEVDADKIDIVGFGSGGLVGLFAGTLVPGIRSVAAVGGLTTQAAAIEHLLHDKYFLYQPNLLPKGDVGAALKLLAPKRCRLVCFEDDADWPADGAREVVQAMKSSYEQCGKAQALAVQWLNGKPEVSKKLKAEILAWLETL